MFRMCGNIVELFRYKVKYDDTKPTIIDGELAQQPVTRTEYCISDSHRDEFIQTLGDKSYIITAIDQTANEWLDGLSFDSYEVAQKALEIGESAYKQMKRDTDNDLQMALSLIDFDYRILLLEWGLAG